MGLIRSFKKFLGLEPAFAFADQHLPADSKRKILFLADDDRATFHLYFRAPILKVLGRSVAFGLLTQKGLDEILERHGAAAVETWLFENFRPTHVVFTRFGRPSGETICQMAQRRNVPVIYHLDDDLLEVPQTLGAEIIGRHNTDSLNQGRRVLISKATLVLASTSPLAKVLTTSARSVSVGPPPPYMPPSEEGPKRTDIFTIGYMGSRGHGRDLEMIKPALRRFLVNYPARFETFGTIEMPRDIKQEFGDKISEVTSISDYDSFLRQLSALNWSLGVAPLVRDRFNLCKTPIKFIEYSAAGIPVLASNIAVYSDFVAAHAIQLADDDQWYSAFVTAFEQRELLSKQASNARKYCQKTFAIEKTARVLEDALDTVVK